MKIFMGKLCIEVKDLKNKVGCEKNYKVGQRWEMVDNSLPGGICIGAMSALLPWITCIKYNAKMPWTKPNQIEVCCTDPDHPIVFEITYKD